MAIVVMGGEEKNNPDFHDFLGMSCGGSGSGSGDRVVKGDASVSMGASSAGFRLLSGSSDWGSGSKRSNSDSAFMGPMANRMHSVISESPEYVRLKKMYGKEAPTVWERRPSDAEMMLSMKPLQKQASTSFILHSPLNKRPDPSVSKWELSMPLDAGQAIHCSSRFGQGGIAVDKISSHAYDDNKSGCIANSQTAADEGSRTGIKGAGILNIVKSSTMAVERSSTGMLPSSSKQRIESRSVMPESSIMPSHHGTAPVSRQMTIFYDGQAHVFDDVHPNKADVIMALAGSNGGSWSTSYGKSISRSHVDEAKASFGEKEPCHGKLAFAQNAIPENSIQMNNPSQSIRVPGSGDFLNWTTGVREGSRAVISTRPITLTEPNSEAERKS